MFTAASVCPRNQKTEQILLTNREQLEYFFMCLQIYFSLKQVPVEYIEVSHQDDQMSNDEVKSATLLQQQNEI